MAARSYQEEIERQRTEQGERFLKQMGEMFAQTRTDLAQQFIPRQEGEARFDHLEQVVERIGAAMEKLTDSVAHSQETNPRIYADRAETKQDLAELKTEIEKLKTARETDMQRGYGWRFEDVQGRYKGDEQGERGWRTVQQQHTNQTADRLIMGFVAFGVLAINIIVTLATYLATRGP